MLSFHLNKIIKRSFENFNKKNIRNTKVVYLHEESLPNLSLHMLVNVMLIEKKMYIKQFCGFA